MLPRLCATLLLSLIGVADVRLSPAVRSFSCERKGWDAIYDKPVLTHCFPYPAHCASTPNFEMAQIGGSGTIYDPTCAHVRQAVNVLCLVICMLMLSTGFVGYDNMLDTIVVAIEGGDGQQL